MLEVRIRPAFIVCRLWCTEEGDFGVEKVSEQANLKCLRLLLRILAAFVAWCSGTPSGLESRGTTMPHDFLPSAAWCMIVCRFCALGYTTST